MEDRNETIRKRIRRKRAQRLHACFDQDLSQIEFELEKKYDEYQKKKRNEAREGRSTTS